MVKDAIQQGLMFDVSEEHWELLEECDRMIATREEKICNLISDLIERQRKAQIILSEIKKVLDKYPEVILKGDWDIGNCNLVEHKIHLEHDRPIKSLVRYINLRLVDSLKENSKRWKRWESFRNPVTL